MLHYYLANFQKVCESLVTLTVTVTVIVSYKFPLSAKTIKLLKWHSRISENYISIVDFSTVSGFHYLPICILHMTLQNLSLRMPKKDVETLQVYDFDSP